VLLQFDGFRFVLELKRETRRVRQKRASASTSVTQEGTATTGKTNYCNGARPCEKSPPLRKQAILLLLG
jgi:hypothetical protein